MAKLTFSLVANSKLATSFKVNSTPAASWDFSVISRTPTFENNSEQLFLFKPEKLISTPVLPLSTSCTKTVEIVEIRKL